MRHRLYYLLPDASTARAAMDALLLARIEAGHIHFMSGASLPPELPEANLLQRTDIVRGAEMGLAVGAALGLLAGVGLLYYFDLDGACVKAAGFVGRALWCRVLSALSTMWLPAARPNTSRSSREFVPSRFAPCTLTHEHSPTA